MTRETVFCTHYRAMSSHATCEAGVPYESLKGLPWDRRPCFARPGEPPRPGCDLVQLPTPAELAEEEAEINARLARIGNARQAIVAHLGGPWKRGTPGASGAIDCPNCGAAGALRFSRAGYNGHVHARCSTPGCASWME